MDEHTPLQQLAFDFSAPPRKRGNNRCAVEGCMKPYRCKGYCARHYVSWCTYGDPLAMMRYERSGPACKVPGCTADLTQQRATKGYCSLHYQRFLHHGDPLGKALHRHNGPHARPIAERFWEKVNKDGPTPTHRPELGPCWVWRPGARVNGYGMFFVHKRGDMLAHRAAWEVQHGPIPEGLNVLHACDNRLCVRHLFLGTHDDNMADMAAKGRGALGERNGRARLTKQQVVEIRQAYANYTHSEEELAVVYKVAQATIKGIILRKSWKHI